MGLFDRLRRGGGASPSGPSPEVEAVFAKFYRLMTDDAVQNTMCRPALLQAMAAGGAVDQIAGATGNFGRDPRNPVPVNGPVGELVYLSNLVVPAGSHVVGHRIGSVDRIDVYETVALDGSRWDLLFFDLYHTRKSQLFPSGFRGASTPQGFFLSTNRTVPGFPVGFYEAMQRGTTEILGVATVSPDLRGKDDLFRGLARPPAHVQALRALKLTASGQPPG